jgi:serine/threonine protein kinase
MDIKIQPNQKIYKFQFIRKLGGGAFGEVWQAYDSFIDKLAAVKVLAGNTTVDNRLLEAKVGSKLSHANLVNVHYAETIAIDGKNYVFIVMDYLQSGSLVSQLNSCNFLPLPQVLSYSRNILCGLEYLHEMNFYHNDIKPQNILIGDGKQAVLSDYGITCFSKTGSATEARSFYKLHAAPETITKSSASVQTDIYQLGVTMFRLLVGIGCLHEKFCAVDETNFYEMVCSGTLIKDCDFPAYVPNSLKAIIKKAIAVNPFDRYCSALEMRRALEKITFPGYWTSDEAGNLIGHKGSYIYSFSVEQTAANKYVFIAKKKNTKSGKEAKISVFCRQNLSRSQLNSLIAKYLHIVVEK